MSRHPLFRIQDVKMRDIAERGHDLTVDQVLPLSDDSVQASTPELIELSQRILAARQSNRPVIIMMGAHAIKLGLSRFLIDLLRRKWVTHLALNGAGVIHDFELSMVGGTSEDVAKWIAVGQFGLWRETSVLNDLIRDAAQRGEGLGEGVGRAIVEGNYPWQSLSLAATGWRMATPVTCHVSIGSDIIHALPNCDGAALGQTSYTDFLIFARAIQELEGGVFLNIGSAVTGPEVYLKALSMARNVARQQEREIKHFTTAVFDLVSLPQDWKQAAPSKTQAGYYYRPWKTILLRTVADGGESFYIQGDFRVTIPGLWKCLRSHEHGPAFATQAT